MRYGYIGLGMMGSAMTEHLLSTGASVTVFDLDTAAVDRAVAAGAEAADSAASVARAADVVSICVPAAEHVAAVLAGPGGIAEAEPGGRAILVHSTVHPDSMRESWATASAWGAAVFDACVAGGPDAARKGELVLFVAGDDPIPDHVRTLLGIYGSKIIEAGPSGAGAALKIGVNVMTYAQQVAAKTAFELVAGVGGDTDALVAAWRHTGQLGRLTEQFLPMVSIPAEHIAGEFRDALLGTVAIEQKDLALAHALSTGALADVLAATRAAIPTTFNVQERP